MNAHLSSLDMVDVCMLIHTSLLLCELVFLGSSVQRQHDEKHSLFSPPAAFIAKTVWSFCISFFSPSDLPRVKDPRGTFQRCVSGSGKEGQGLRLRRVTPNRWESY